MVNKPRIATQNTSFPRFGLVLIDVIILVVCSLLMFKLRNPSIALSPSYQLFITILVLLSINVFSITGVYQHKKGQRLDKDIANLFVSLLLVVLIVSVLTFFSKSGESFSRLWLGLTIISSFILMATYRFIQWQLARNRHRSGFNQTRVAIVGAGTLGELTCDAMLEETWSGYKPIALFSDSKPRGHIYKNLSVQGPIDDLIDFIEQNRQTGEVIHEVWIALPLEEASKIEGIHNALKNTAVNVFLVPDLMGFNLADYAIEEAAGLPVIDLSASPLKHSKTSLKRIEDIVISILMLTVLSPLFILVAILIKRESQASIFFKQRRYGLDGQEFNVWKFRSMTSSDDDGEIKQATQNDARVTNIGRFIRRYSIDELPQLFNVLYGSMSLVGPRPHAVAHNEYYRDKIDGYMSRHVIKPGMTGWAQVNGCRGETDTLDKMKRRVRYDIEYIQKWSIFLDLRILLKTFVEVFSNRNVY